LLILCVVDTAAAAGLTYFDFIVHSGQGVAINQVSLS
jgi:hypothetical protein